VAVVQERSRRVPPVLNAANALTVVRIGLVPVFVLLVIVSDMTDTGWRIAAALTFGVAAFTDFVDGWIARRWQLVTSFGKVADPIADKALTGAALVLFSAYGALPWWVTLVILIREWGITAMRFWVLRYGVISASRGGKLKTVLQLSAIAWYLWPFPQPWASVGPWLMGAALVVTVVTGIDYVARAVRLRRGVPKLSA
jgi:CDP-diacylglycerol--glycerol-3-phosphate 3-phosphatidyltransferase